ncbi:MAG: hypothetical protein WCR87_03145 [Saccharofermentanales bacterium]
MKEMQGPFPAGVAGLKSIAANNLPPLFVSVSGNLTSSVSGAPIGAARCAGRVRKFWFTLGASGKDDTNPLQVSGELKINGTTCLSTRPSIGHISGEASQHKTTLVTGDTGMTQAVIDGDANSFSAGDIFTYDLDLVRTASPDTEISSIVVCAELEPLIG